MVTKKFKHTKKKLHSKLKENIFPDLKILNGTREKYSGIEGKVLQAQGLHVAHIAQLYCRIKFQT